MPTILGHGFKLQNRFLWERDSINHLTRNTCRETDLQLLSAYGSEVLVFLNIMHCICKGWSMQAPTESHTLNYMDDLVVAAASMK